MTKKRKREEGAQINMLRNNKLLILMLKLHRIMLIGKQVRLRILID